jgi:hypothetical protein
MIIIENLTVSQYLSIYKNIRNTPHSLYKDEGGGMGLTTYRLSVEWLKTKFWYTTKTNFHFNGKIM